MKYPFNIRTKYNLINDICFNGLLPNDFCMRWVSLDKKSKTDHDVAEVRFENYRVKSLRIVNNPKDKRYSQIESLLHEMIHIYIFLFNWKKDSIQDWHHNKYFLQLYQSKARKLGFTEKQIDRELYSLTQWNNYWQKAA